MVGVVIANVDGLHASLYLCHQVAQELLVLTGRKPRPDTDLGGDSRNGRHGVNPAHAVAVLEGLGEQDDVALDGGDRLAVIHHGVDEVGDQRVVDLLDWHWTQDRGKVHLVGGPLVLVHAGVALGAIDQALVLGYERLCCMVKGDGTGDDRQAHAIC